jgi:hypothetical protein
MKVVLIVVVLALVVGSFVVDYMWKRWMEERKKDRG